MARRMLAAFATLAVAVTIVACNSAGAGGEGDHAKEGAPRVTLDSASAKEKLGEDDGFQLAVFYGAELMGSIDDCGCPGHPQGGLPWRLGYTEGFRGAYPDAGYLQLDAGHSMANVIDVDGNLYPDQVTKNDWVVQAFDRFNFDAVNITHNDIYYLARFLHDGGVWDKAVQEHPALTRFISANLEPVKPGLIAPPAYVVRNISGKRIPGGMAKIAIIGLTEPNPVLPKHTGFNVTNPEVALEKILPKARAEADLVFVMYYASPEIADSLAKRLSGQVDAFIVAHPQARETQPKLDTPEKMVYARFQTRNLGELRVHLDPARKPSSMTNRYITLDELLPKDPIAEKMAADAKEAIRQAQMERFNNANPPGASSAPAANDLPPSGGK